MDDVTSSHADAKEQDRIYQKAQTQIDKILDPDAQMSSILMGSKKRLGLGWTCMDKLIFVYGCDFK